MTNLEWIRTLSEEEFADWLYDEWLHHLQYRWSSSRGGLIIWLKDRKDKPSGDNLSPVEDEPQSDAEIARAIVHKMIDDAVIAEDAYPDLRQKMHDAVDEYEPQRGCDADCTEDCNECAKEWQDWKDRMWAETIVTEPQTERSE